MVHDKEVALQALESKWERVKLQTGWCLEKCTKPVNCANESSTDATAKAPYGASTDVDINTDVHSDLEASNNPFVSLQDCELDSTSSTITPSNQDNVSTATIHDDNPESDSFLGSAQHK